MEAEPDRTDRLRPRRHRRRTVRRSRTPLVRRIRSDPAAVRAWLLIAVLAVALASLVQRSLDAAEQAQAGWGRKVTVWVTDRPVRAGERLADVVRPQPWPSALVPPQAVADRPTSARARGPLDAGIPLTAAMVDRAGSAGDRRTIAVAMADAALPVREGDRVDVWATGDPTEAVDGDAATRVAAGAVVIEAQDGSVVLAITPAEVRTVAAAAAMETLALVGSG